MKALKTTLVSTLCGWLSVGGLHGQNTITHRPRPPLIFVR